MLGVVPHPQVYPIIGFLLVAKDFVTIHRNCLDGTNAKNMVTGQPLGHSKALKIKPFLWE
jgi:hypothetical protein